MAPNHVSMYPKRVLTHETWFLSTRPCTTMRDSELSMNIPLFKDIPHVGSFWHLLIVNLYFYIRLFDSWECHFWYPGTILSSKIYNMLGLSGTLSYAVFVYLYFCICMFDSWKYHFWYPWTILFSKIYNMLGLSGTLSYAVFVYLCICVFVFLYLHVWLMEISFLISLNNPLFKNIQHVGSFWYFVMCFICVFVYLCICICVFVYETLGNISFDILGSSAFRKYMVCMV